jgi:hypothetical protein
MKYFLFLGLVLTSLGFTLKGEGPAKGPVAYRVTYQHAVYKLSPQVNTSMMEVPEDLREAIGKDSLRLTDVITLPILSIAEMEVAADGSYVYRERMEQPGMSFADDQPKYYRKGKFYRGNEPEALEPMVLKLQPKGGRKTLLGYACQEFEGLHASTGTRYRLWATKALPSSLTALPVVKPFGYAVLELERVDGSWKRTAIKVEKQ